MTDILAEHSFEYDNLYLDLTQAFIAIEMNDVKVKLAYVLKQTVVSLKISCYKFWKEWDF